MKPTSDPEPNHAGASAYDVPPPQFTSDQRQPILSAAVEFDVSLFTFEGVEFGGPLDASALGSEGARAFSRVSPADLQLLADHARGNIVALARGWTPNAYVYGVSDGKVVGLALAVQSPSSAKPLHLAQFSMRPGLPLQATLFRLCEVAAQALGRSAVAPESIRVGVTVLSDPARHGTVREPDLRGLDPARRVLLPVEHDKRAWAFAPSRSPDDLLAGIRGQFDVLDPEGAALFSLAAESTEPEIDFRSAPRPALSGGTRRSAVAGTFYPAEPSKLTPMVDALLAASERRAESWPAAMVPHAGLVYSGRLAAAVFNRLKIPELAIVIGPKHTRQGVDWAVAPHEAWSIPGAMVSADPAVARSLVEAIPGLQLDAAAHSREHAIEVELPFFVHFAPATRVVGIAIGGGNWEACQRFAHGLAEVIRHLPTHPLLVISSDMNHFATDRENRRLDAIALDAMERLDPAHLLATVTDHNISMCGVLPAVIVMETLRQLGGLTDCERVGYATSAEVNGNTSRVVGYAGMLLN